LSVTAFPTILFLNGTGSDSSASGAGPSTALTGTAGTTDGAGTTVTLDSGTDLTNVATDGSHVIYLVDPTAGHRNFAAINGKAGSGGATPTVTVEQAFSATVGPFSWAIGGIRATIGSASSRLLFDNNTGNGDAMPGWTMQMQSGHTETTGRIDIYRDATAGAIQLKGDPLAVVMPVLTCNESGNPFFVLRAAGQRLMDFAAKNNQAANTCRFAVCQAVNVLRGIVCADAAEPFQKFAEIQVTGTVINGCDIGFLTDYGIYAQQPGVSIIGNFIHDCGSFGVKFDDPLSMNLSSNVIANNAGDGVIVVTNSSSNRSIEIIQNTIDNNGGDGIDLSSGLVAKANVVTNLITNNGGYGIRFNGSETIATLRAQAIINSDNTFNNTSGATNLTGAIVNDPGLDPEYAGGGDYTPTNTSLQGVAFPASVNGFPNYAYPGAIQPQGSSGSGGGANLLGNGTLVSG